MRLITLVVMLGVVSSAQAEGWLCIADGAAGFRYDLTAKEWKPKIFKAGNKYVIKREKSDDPNASMGRWVLVDFGDEFKSASCEEEEAGKWLFCDGLVGKFSLRTDQRKFMYQLRGMYFSDPKDWPSLGMKEGDLPDDPVIEIGTCTAL